MNERTHNYKWPNEHIITNEQMNQWTNERKQSETNKLMNEWTQLKMNLFRGNYIKHKNCFQCLSFDFSSKYL